VKNNLTLFILLCGLLPRAAIAQIGVADPVTGNAAINFYGRTVDQDGKPLAGVKVTLSVFSEYLHSATQLGDKHDRTVMETDSNGNFALTGSTGHSVEVQSFEKEGYKPSDKIKRLYPYSWSADIFHPDPSNPVIFKMWKKIGAEKLLQTSWHGKVPCDGTTNRFDAVKGTHDGSGNLEIVCNRTPFILTPETINHFNWVMQISVVGGGIQATEDEFSYRAPEQGYTQSVAMGKMAGDPGWPGKTKQEFYIKTADNHFGRLWADWDAGQDSPTHLEWDCSINPSGSRNLER
jgi:hypothetical protein